MVGSRRRSRLRSGCCCCAPPVCPPAPASLLTGGCARVGQQVDVSLLQRVRREAPVALGAAGVMVLKEGHRPGGPPAHEAGRLARRVLQAPVLAALEDGVQDARGSDICTERERQAEKGDRSALGAEKPGQLARGREVVRLWHTTSAHNPPQLTLPPCRRRHSPKAVARPPAALIQLTMRCLWASWLCAGVPSSW